MHKYIVLLSLALLCTACSESDLPTAQIQPALDKAQQAADLAAQHSKDLQEDMLELLDE
ncbi:MAG: hypothetical protein Q9M19_06225 [Mariprofundaceae bacterium]|nr:hypothetical protein [Mariprofundaceae bacterium]